MSLYPRTARPSVLPGEALPLQFVVVHDTKHREYARQQEGLRRMPPRLLRYAMATVLLLVWRPAYANGGHLHRGGVFFLLLGLVLCLGGLGLVLYLLFRAHPEEADEERTHE